MSELQRDAQPPAAEAGTPDCLRLVVLVSGSGSNLQAILDALAAGQLAAQVVLVVANRKAAYGLVRAAQAGIPTCCLTLKPYLAAGHSRADYDAALADQIVPYQPDLVVLAGWMHILGPAFLERFPQRVINLHPALPGAFPGTDAIRRAYAAYRAGEIEHSGCMVHYAVPEVDAGPTIAQAVVPFAPDDTLEAFEARMHAAEHQLIVAAIRLADAQLREHRGHRPVPRLDNLPHSENNT
jgi:formyltetrahydrofolate-dependent phosphoribosylglycinamide formyltransferase